MSHRNAFCAILFATLVLGCEARNQDHQSGFLYPADECGEYWDCPIPETDCTYAYCEVGECVYRADGPEGAPCENHSTGAIGACTIDHLCEPEFKPIVQECSLDTEGEPCGDGSWSCSSGNCVPTTPSCETDYDCPSPPCKMAWCEQPTCKYTSAPNGTGCTIGLCADGVCK